MSGRARIIRHAANHLPGGSDPLAIDLSIGAAFQHLVLAEPTLFAFWPLTDAASPAADLGPHNLTQVASGSPTFGVAGPFPPETAINFGNNSNLIGSIPAGPLTATIFGNTHAFTIEALVYMPSTADANDWVFAVQSGTSIAIAVGLSSAYGTNAVGFVRGDTGSSVGTGLGAGTSLTVQRWTPVVLTYDGSNCRLYVNGALTQTIADTNDLGGQAGGVDLLIGAYGFPSLTQSKAYVSNVALYTEALSAGVIAGHAALFRTGGQGGLGDHGQLDGLSDDDHPQYLLRSLLTTKGDLILATASAVLARLGIGSNGTVLKAASGETTGAKWEAVADSEVTFTDITTNNASTTKHGFLKKLSNVATEFLDGTGAFDTVKDSDLSTSDITTNDVTTSKHGFAPKAPNDTAKFLRGDGTWAAPSSLPSGSAAVATDAIWDAPGDLAIGTGADAATRLAIGALGTFLRSNGTTGAWALPGLAPIFDTTLGSDTATIDITSISGSYTHLLLVCHLLCDGSASAAGLLRFNNDSTSGNYTDQRLQAFSTTVQAGENFSTRTSARFGVVPGSAQANYRTGYFSPHFILIPNYSGATYKKAFLAYCLDTQAVNATSGLTIELTAGTWDATAAAINRITMIPGAASNFKTGSRVTIYGLGV